MVLKDVNSIERSYLVDGLERNHLADGLESAQSQDLYPYLVPYTSVQIYLHLMVTCLVPPAPADSCHSHQGVSQGLVRLA